MFIGRMLIDVVDVYCGCTRTEKASIAAMPTAKAGISISGILNKMLRMMLGISTFTLSFLRDRSESSNTYTFFSSIFCLLLQ